MLLHARGQRSSWMTVGAGVTSNVIKDEDFDPAEPRAGLARAIEWAEEKSRKLTADYKNVYPWTDHGSVGKQVQLHSADIGFVRDCGGIHLQDHWETHSGSERDCLVSCCSQLCRT